MVHRSFVAMNQGTIQLADFKAAWEANRTAYLEAIDRVGRSGWLILGKEVEAFEKDLARAWGLPFAVGVANGLDALEIAFRCLGARPGDRVLTTPLSAFATTLAILKVGGVPEFVDVDASGLLDLGLVRQRLSDKTRPPIRFLVPVHLFGHAVSLDGLEQLTRQYGVSIVEDCAQAIGAKSGGRNVGTVGALCATSFYPTKNLGAFGDGGALLGADREIMDTARALRDYGQTEKYVHTKVGLNSRLDELQAALLRSVQLPLLEAQTRRRAAIAARFLTGIRNDGLDLVPVPPGCTSVWHLFPVLVDDRAGFRDFLKARGVSTGLHYPMLIPAQAAMAAAGFKVASEGAYPVAERFARAEVSLPLHPFLSDDEVERVVAACNDWRP